MKRNETCTETYFFRVWRLRPPAWPLRAGDARTRIPFQLPFTQLGWLACCAGVPSRASGVPVRGLQLLCQ